MAWRAYLKERGIISFSTPAIAMDFQHWKQNNVGKEIEIDLAKTTVSDEMRGYMFGAVIPFLKRLVPAWDKLDNEQVYEILKKVFHYFEAFNPVTQRVERYGQSIMSKDVDKEEARAFLQEIETWVMENYGRHLPDPAKYKAWKDSAPGLNETYTEEI